jgi:predicted CXXCH cytochrome family protein
MMQAWQWARSHRLGLGFAMAVLVMAGWAWHAARLTGVVHEQTASVAGQKQAPVVHFVGSQACAGCHQAEDQAWRGSHHQLAMQAATPATVLAPFRGERLTEGGVTSVFSQRGGRYYVNTEGPDGRQREFEVTHALGVAPLQQYLVPMPNKGMQALSTAWDARPRAQGGQRWFDLHRGQRVRAGDELHWTGRQNNWNFMCAECHTTQFKKNFDPANRTYSSTWSEMNVSCEACHGPGSNHVAWGGLAQPARQADRGKGLTLWLDERKGAQWSINAATGNAQRSLAPMALAQRQELELCARCHAHRSQISDDQLHGKPLLDTHVPSLLEPGLFWEDGQMKAEVYNYASFQQSRMYQKGVTCSDCHDPHTAKLRAPGNPTCLQCHAPAKYETPAHHFHPLGSAGASCASCHMPVTTYMVVDPRHDHGIRVPRPDLSLQNGAPNACGKCHADKSPSWAAQWALRWYPDLRARQAPLAQALVASGNRDAANLGQLFGIMNDAELPAVLRASALARAAPWVGSAQLPQIGALTKDTDSLVRLTAVEAFAGLPAEARPQWLLPALADPVRAVRIAAARWLAGLPARDWSAIDQARFAGALKEYIGVQQFNADRPEAYNNLGTLYADQGDWATAEQMLKQAISVDPGFTASALNLADVYREQGREDEAQALVRAVLRRHPADAAAHNVLGLSLLRQKRLAEALKALQQAAGLAQQSVRFAYVYALALEAAGQRRQAVAELERVLKLHPGDRDTLAALQAICQRSQDAACVQRPADRPSGRP